MTAPNIQWKIEDLSLGVVNATRYNQLSIDNSDNLIIPYVTYDVSDVQMIKYVNGNLTVIDMEYAYYLSLLKLDSSGVVMWGVSNEDWYMHTEHTDLYTDVDSSNNTVVGYITKPKDNSNTFLLLNTYINIIKFDENGSFLWHTDDICFNTFKNNKLTTLKVDNNNNIVFAYSTEGLLDDQTSDGNSHIIIIKLDPNGSILWRLYDLSLNTRYNDYSPNIAIDSNNNIFVTYYTLGNIYDDGGVGTYDFNEYTEIVLAKFDENGNRLWIKQETEFNANELNGSPRLTIDDNNNVILTYETHGVLSGSSKTGENDIAIVKFDNDGTVIWKKQNESFNTTADNLFPQLKTDDLNNIYLTYYTNGEIDGFTNIGGYDTVIVKFDKNGEVLWKTQDAEINTNRDNYNSSIVLNESDNVYLLSSVNRDTSNNIMTKINLSLFKFNDVYVPPTPAEPSNNDPSTNDPSSDPSTENNQYIGAPYYFCQSQNPNYIIKVCNDISENIIPKKARIFNKIENRMTKAELRRWAIRNKYR